MRFIAHRGNIFGPRPEYENKIDYMWNAYDVCRGLECDVQSYKDKLYFGHDEPQEEVDVSLMTMQNVFCHAKDLTAMLMMIDMKNVHCFWHQEDTITLTNRGFVWCYPGHYPVHEKAIWLDLHGAELPKDKTGIWGICGDRHKYAYEVHR